MNRGVTAANLANYGTSWSIAEYTREDDLRPIEAMLVQEYFPRATARVLDLGCGAGRTTIALARRGYRVTGIDMSDVLLAEGRRRYAELDLRLMDARNLEFPDAAFDAAIFSFNGIDCIYPVSARIQCMAEVLRVLKPRAPFLLSSHNLVGSIFSGGYLYPRGYWNAAKLLAAQVGNRLAWQWYVRYRDGGGVQYLYSAPPGQTVHHLESIGFTVVDARSLTGERRWRPIVMHAQHVHFVAMKPEGLSRALRTSP